jgi:hypothetical protein
MATARTKRAAPRVPPAVAVDGAAAWALPALAGGIALLAAIATATELVAPAPGLAVTILATLALLADRGLQRAVGAARPGTAVLAAIGVAWIVICYLPFHELLFPGTPLHQPVTLRSNDATLPVTLGARDHGAVDMLLEGELPPNPGGGTAIPVNYTIVVEDAAHVPQTVSGRFDETLRTQRLGRRGTATVVQAHHAARQLVANAARGDLTITSVVLEPAEGASVTLTAYTHHLPSTPILVILMLVVLAAALAVDVKVVPASEGTFTLVTGAALGTAIAIWTSNTVHPSVSSLIGAMIFGGPLGLGLGALAWAIARRTLVRTGR